ncbi:MAG: hypothetical protein WDM85_18280 [Caulobacteraceae bacterium]
MGRGRPRRVFGLTRDDGLAEDRPGGVRRLRPADPRPDRGPCAQTRPTPSGRRWRCGSTAAWRPSPWFAQRLADLTGLVVGRASYQETTALGAALFAGLGAGCSPRSRSRRGAARGGDLHARHGRGPSRGGLRPLGWTR